MDFALPVAESGIGIFIMGTASHHLRMGYRHVENQPDPA